MNEIAASLSVALLRMSLFLGAAALAVQLLLVFAGPGSPRVHRAAWFLVLLQGWFWWRLPVTIACYQPAVVKQASSAPIAPITWPRLAPAPVPIAGEHHPAAQRPAIPHHERVAIDAPRPVDRQTARSWTATLRQDWPVAVLGAWAAGMLILAGVSVAGYLRFLRSLHAARPGEDAWVREWEDLLARHHVRGGVPLWVTANAGPLVCLAPWGYRLVVPAGLWQRLAPAGRLSILRHELAHLKRRDLVKSILVRLLVLPQWFNPLAWLAVRRFDEAAEWACDELAKGADWEGCRAYARALLQLDAARGPRPSYHAAASGRGLSLRVQRLLSPQVKEDPLMKKTLILGTALGLALLCLVRLDLVAKEPAAKGGADTAAQGKPAGGNLDARWGGRLGAYTGAAVGAAIGSPQPAAVDALRYMPNGCRWVAWFDAAALHKHFAKGAKTIASSLGLQFDDFTSRATIGSAQSLIRLDDGKGPGPITPSNGVMVATLARPVTVSELKANLGKEGGKHPWREETVRGVTLHVQESDQPIAFCLPEKQTLVSGSARLVRQVLLRGTRVQLPGKLAATWDRLDRSHAIGLAMAPPAAGDPARAFLPDELCNGSEAILLEADVVAGKDLRFRFSVPCADAGIAYQVRGLCATYCKAGAAGSPQFADAAKSLQFAVNDRCFVLQGTLPASIFQDDKSAPPAAGITQHSFSPRSLLPDDVCDGVEAIHGKAEMASGKDLHFHVSVPCVDAGVAYEVCGLCATVLKIIGTQFPRWADAAKSFQFAVNDRCFVLQGTLPASTFQDALGLKTAMRNLLPDDVCDGIQGVRVKADMVADKDVCYRFSVPCVDAGIAYQVRGLCAFFCKACDARAGEKSPGAGTVKPFQFTVSGRCFVFEGRLPASIVQDGFKTATSYTSQRPQVSLAVPDRTNGSGKPGESCYGAGPQVPAGRQAQRGAADVSRPERNRLSTADERTGQRAAPGSTAK
jgi:beta-lactamase regulating signal transducer with metallopeptidase domain